MKKTTTLIILLAAAVMFGCQKPRAIVVIPEPVEITPKSGQFTIDSRTTLCFGNLGAEASETSKIIRELYEQYFGMRPNLGDAESAKKRSILFSVSEKEIKGIGSEGYVLRVRPNRIVAEANTAAGLFYAMQTLMQMAGTDKLADSKSFAVPCAVITDYPRFGYRGAHLDVSRHFFDTAFVKKYIDMLAFYKINKFHWHLTDDHGWRVQTDQYPELTRVGAWRPERTSWDTLHPVRPDEPMTYGGFYTKEQIRDIVHYAAVRGIDVVPEMDFPGHSLAEIRCYPWLSCHGDGIEPLCLGNDRVLDFCKKVFDEVFDLFPYEYVEIGGDEVIRERWSGCELCQERIRKEGLADVAQLQAWFTREMEKHFNAQGRKMVGWDEILDGGVSPTATVNWWRSDPVTFKKAAVNGNEIIMCPTTHCYFDYAQDDQTMRHLYEDNLIPETLTPDERKLIKGMQANIWCEFIPTESRMQTMVFPRAIALAEKTWTPMEAHDFEDFVARLKDQLGRLDIMGVDYRPLDAGLTVGFNTIMFH